MADPFVSIVVPTYRRPARLADCLRSFTALDYPPDRFEVVVVDDGSGAPPEAAVAAAGRRVHTSLVVVEHAGPAAARNAGAARAKGELLAFTDDDCRVTAGWLRAFAARFRTGDGAMLGGRTVNALTANACASASQVLIDYLYRHYNADPDNARFFASNNLAVPTDRFQHLGGFDTSFALAAGEDRELCHRWRGAGHRLVYVPDAIVLHAHALTLRQFWRQHFDYGRGAAHLRSRLPRERESAISLESPSFYLQLLTCALRLPRGAPRRASITALLAFSQMATAAGVWRERWRRSRP